MGKRIELAGQRFERLLVIEKAPSTTVTRWHCVCNCGESRVVATFNLIKGRAKSCGCLQKEITSRRSTTHGLTKSGAWKSWRAMWSRCTVVTNGSYPNYGGRGIAVCDRWKSFENFYADMGDRPAGMTLDRHPHADGNYEPGNCRWAGKEAQDTNKRTNVYVTWNGRTLTYSQWAIELSTDPSVLRRRYKKFRTFEPVVRDRDSYSRKR